MGPWFGLPESVLCRRAHHPPDFFTRTFLPVGRFQRLVISSDLIGADTRHSRRAFPLTCGSGTAPAAPHGSDRARPPGCLCQLQGLSGLAADTGQLPSMSLPLSVRSSVMLVRARPFRALHLRGSSTVTSRFRPGPTGLDLLGVLPCSVVPSTSVAQAPSPLGSPGPSRLASWVCLCVPLPCPPCSSVSCGGWVGQKPRNETKSRLRARRGVRSASFLTARAIAPLAR